MKVCKEMKKLRKWLDENNIEWKDVSTDTPCFYICRTHFLVKKNFFSVIHGYGSYGGKRYYMDGFKDLGLLECMVNGMEPVGWLTAEDVIEKIKEMQK